MAKELLHAIHALDVRNFLEKHGLLQEIETGRITCNTCGEVMTVGSFGAVTRYQNELKFSCAKEACLLAFFDLVATGAPAGEKTARAVVGART
jgi:hypothetical protein